MQYAYRICCGSGDAGGSLVSSGVSVGDRESDANCRGAIAVVLIHNNHNARPLESCRTYTLLMAGIRWCTTN